MHGTGVAASCCHRLLSAADVDVRWTEADRPRVPAVMLGPATQSLLADVFGSSDLLAGLWPIRRRVVAWGSAPVVDLPHTAIVVSEPALLARLRCSGPASLEQRAAEADWAIHTSRPSPGISTLKFGDRLATATQVQLSSNADAAACLVESVPAGWLFLLPVDPGTAWMLTAGASREILLSESRLVAESVGGILAEGGSFPAYPRISDSLSGDRWLACGSAALAFDPLCGDGTAHAIREAILASAVIRASSNPALAEELTWEYRLRLWAGFRRHLEQCQPFYRTGGTGEWWQAESHRLSEGLEWATSLRSPIPLGRFRLNGFDLDRVG